MAFRVPSQVHHQRRSSLQNASPRPAPPAVQITPSTYSPREEESQEWVLFSPETAPSTTARTHTTSTERTPRTAGRSRLSDFGSLGTALQSGTDLEHDHDDLLEEDATELDSLDDGLHAFREPTPFEPAPDQFQLHQSDPAVLPAHDGLGTFAPTSLHIQEQLWQHEPFNPLRKGETRPRRRSSVQRHLDSVDEMQNWDMDKDRWQRIEQWRMEQSRALLQEIEKETRRKRYSRQGRVIRPAQGVERQPSSAAVETVTESSAASGESQADASQEGSKENLEAEESFWRRITRKVIRDLIGIDDAILAVIFGEALVEDVEEEKHGQSEHARSQQDEQSKSKIRIDTERPKDLDEMLKGVISPSSSSAVSSDGEWQQRLLDRIARELGVLVHQLCEHPGAFSTYLNTSASPPSDFPGISTSKAPSFSSQSRPRTSRSASYGSSKNSPAEFTPTFTPTLQDTAGPNHAALWGIEEEDPLNANGRQSSADAPHFPRSEDGEYWEQDLDMKMVFHYLYKTLAGKAPFSNDGTSTPKPSSPNGQEGQDASCRAAIIRHHHPLVARADAHARSHRPPPRHWQTSSLAQDSAPAGLTTLLLLLLLVLPRPLGSGSSRHYWDIGGSVGSGSAIVTVGGAGGMGSWGDV
ncbi:predicted protein [Uncinocarpus reesii 1704]|uniref:Uncharacterized protein n=1 Tax=Uncinocarpus reesii (strain UAMH 1704) TaxID=336963 RepID=C4JFG5_UNCRE|nr:uncharacterized protein UREG_00979 [Uncinocarpus reesii 1704]EEP76130.1 predicted protein [Uncinocarpus reesii 1704]